jgi:erythromycin esterase
MLNVEMSRRAAVVVAFVVALTASAQRHRIVSPTPPVPPATTITQWLEQSAIRFDTTTPSDDHRDLMPLRGIIGDARIVGAGEATHGSAEFQTMKDRLFRFLVEEMGFTVFAIEGSLPEADAVNDYIHGGPGTAADVVRGMHFWTWSTTEVDAFVDWMRAYNLAHPDAPQISFRGFDMQYSQDAIARINAYLQRVDPANASARAAQLSCADSYLFTGYPDLPLAQRNACRDSITAAYDAIAAARESYIAASDAAEYERVLRYARVVVQDEDTAGHAPLLTPARDAYMAENVEWIAETEHPGEKIMLWAHNSHIGSYFDVFMGAHLRSRYPKEYLNIGLLFDRGAYTARDAAPPNALGVYHVDGAPASGFESFFKATGRPRLIADLRAAPPLIQARLSQGNSMWAIGSVSTPNRIAEIVRYDVDAVIWIEQVTATHVVGF